jgi:polysaccharide biosynthesis transport protein
VKALTQLPPTPSNDADPSLNSMDDYGAGGSSSGRRRFWVFLRKYWWVPVFTLLIASGTAIGYVTWAPPIFVSTAAMWETEKLHLSEGALFTEDATTYIGTQIQLLKSQRMSQAALERVKDLTTNGVPLGTDGSPLKVTLAFREAPRSTVFVITATSADPQYSQNFLDALMTGYLEYKKTVRKLVSGETAASISAQVEALERELESAQNELTVFQRTNNLAILQEEGTIAGGYLEKLQTELSDLQLESQLLKASEVERKAAVPGVDSGARDPGDFLKNIGSTGTSTANNPEFTPYQEVELLKIQREKLSKYLRPKHPKIVALDEQIARGQKLIELFRGQSHDQLLASQEAIRMKIDSVRASIKDWESKVTESSGRIAEAERLRQNVIRSQSTFDRLKTLLENVDITRNTDMETLAILETASAAKRSYDTIIMAAIFALIGGLGIGAGIVFLIEKRDDRFTSVTDVNTLLGDAVVALLPEITGNTKEPLRLLEVGDTRYSFAESYRRLRSALLFLAAEGERPKVLLITSAMPNEGKSTIAANLARTLALSGSRVLLVDADLRRGILHRSLKMQAEPGLAELLLDASEPEMVVQKDLLPNLSFIACGSHSGNPGDLFLGSGLDAHLERWRREFDYVVIDSSPLFAADDASCLAPKVDGTLFVVRRGHSSARAVSEALNLLAQRQARVLGVVFNGADASARSYYYDKLADYNGSAKTV